MTVNYKGAKQQTNATRIKLIKVKLQNTTGKQITEGPATQNARLPRRSLVQGTRSPRPLSGDQRELEQM